MAISEDLKLIAQCPDWTLAVSGVSQDSMLRPRSLSIFISDISSGAKYMLRKSVDMNRVVQLVCLREEMPCRGTLTG